MVMATLLAVQAWVGYSVGCAVNCGTTATAYGKTAYSSAYSQLTTIRSGAGIDLTSGVGVFAVGTYLQ
jgi:hypothetical protein